MVQYLQVSLTDSRSTFTEEVTMLVLSRKIGEEIVIDGTIRVSVAAIKGDRVRIAISAPSHIAVHRNEIAARIAAEEIDTVLACENH